MVLKDEYQGLDEKVEKEYKNRKMKLYKCNLKPIKKKVIIVPFGDVHYGCLHTDIKKAKETLKWISETPGVYMIGMGDLLETGTKSSVGGSVFEQSKFLQDQLEDMVSALKPLAKKGKILGLLTGNHEKRVYNEAGLDLTKIIANELGVPYFGDGVFLKLKVGKNNYTAYATHGSSSSKLPYTQIKSVLDLARFIDCDIYMMGHMHSLQHHAQSYYKVDLKDKQVKEYDKHFLITGSYLDYFDSYAESKNLIPGKKGSPKIKLHSDNKEVRVSL